MKSNSLKYIFKFKFYILLTALMLLGFSCSNQDSGDEHENNKPKISMDAERKLPDAPEPVGALEPPTIPDAPRKGTFKIIDSIPHSTSSFTQGLTFYDGKLIETTGLTGFSKINIIDPKNGKILKSENLPLFIFGEGNVVINDTIYILTYKNQVLYKYSYPELEMISEHSYYGEGWGITEYNGNLLTSDGTNVIKYRNSKSLSDINKVYITRNGRSINYINELERVDDNVYANIWGEDVIISFNPLFGAVAAFWDLSMLRYGQANNNAAEVLNGIAFFAEEKVFFITGKNWNHIYKVKLD